MLSKLKIENKIQENVFNKISPKILSKGTYAHFFNNDAKKSGTLMLKLRLLNKLSIEDICLKLDIPRKRYVEMELGEKMPDSNISYLLVNIFNM